LVEHDQVDAALLQSGGQLDEVLQGTAEPVELGDDELIAAAVRNEQRLVELRSAGKFAGRLVEEDLLAAGRSQGVVLGAWVLVAVETRP
jgi:hypothetical protein